MISGVVLFVALYLLLGVAFDAYAFPRQRLTKLSVTWLPEVVKLFFVASFDTILLIESYFKKNEIPR